RQRGRSRDRTRAARRRPRRPRPQLRARARADRRDRPRSLLPRHRPALGQGPRLRQRSRQTRRVRLHRRLQPRGTTKRDRHHPPPLRRIPQPPRRLRTPRRDRTSKRNPDGPPRNRPRTSLPDAPHALPAQRTQDRRHRTGDRRKPPPTATPARGAAAERRDCRIARGREKARWRGPSRRARNEEGAYALNAPFVLWATTLPVAIFGVFGITASSFSSRSQFVTMRVDSSAWADVSKRPTDVMTPLPASIRK